MPQAATEHRLLRVLVFVVGVSTLGAEIAAARLMAPFFGASTIVWANTIGTVLVALSIGYWLGGRLGDRRPHLAGLARWVLGASVLLALVPIVANPFLTVSVEAFDEIDVGAAVGSLVGVLALIAVPVLLLGAVSPWAIRLSVDRVDDAGRTAGGLYALSTIGSLLGTWLSTLVLIPLIGTQRTFIGMALAVALVAALALPRRMLLVPLGVALLLAIPPGTTKPADDARVLEERETEHQYARVIELPDGERRLELNEGQAYHSTWRRDTVLTDNVWDGYLSTPFTVLGRAAALGRHPRQRRGHHRARVRAAVPRDGDRRRGDRRRADGARAALVRPARPPRRAPPHRRRAPVPAPGRAALGGDHGRRLPPALHPLLPDHAGVLRARARPARAGRRGGRQRRAIPRARPGSRRCSPRACGSAFPHVARDPITEFNTLLIASDRTPSRRARHGRAAVRRPARPPRAGRDRGAARPGAARAAASTRTTRRPVEWLIDRSIISYAADQGCAGSTRDLHRATLAVTAGRPPPRRARR